MDSHLVISFWCGFGVYRGCGRWGSTTFAIYLHICDNISGIPPSCIMRFDGMPSKLKVRIDNHQEIMFGAKGEAADVTHKANATRECG